MYARLQPVFETESSRTVMKAFLCFCALTSCLTAADIHVGKDVPTIQAAIRAAQPGDTIHLEPRVYYDYAGFSMKRGEPGRPITLDGHGATLEGSDPVDPAKWREVAPGLFANDDLMPGLSDAILGRWFFLFEGRMQHMGRTSKGKQTPLKKPAELEAGEWTFVRDPSRESPSSKTIFGTFYLKLHPGRQLADAKVFAPVRSAGVQLSGQNAHLVIKNLTATHPYNDGFNIHGHCEDVLFENIRAIECGDDGISAHETAEYRVEGFVSIGNSTGICDTVSAKTSYNRVFIADCLGYDLFFLDNGRYRLTNAVIFSRAQNPFTVTGRDGQACELEMDNVLFRRLVEPRKGLISKRAVVRAKRLTLQDISFVVAGELQHEGEADVVGLLQSVPEAYRP